MFSVVMIVCLFIRCRAGSVWEHCEATVGRCSAKNRVQSSSEKQCTFTCIHMHVHVFHSAPDELA